MPVAQECSTTKAAYAASTKVTKASGNYQIAPDHIVGVDLYAEGGPAAAADKLDALLNG